MKMDFGKNFIELNLIKLNLFKTQNIENGLFDVIFEIGGKLLYAHKNMLNLVSPTFASMLSDRWMKNKEEPIKIKDYSYDNFYQFITFLYSAKCQLTDENIFKMIDIAEFYGVPLFKDYCDDYLATMGITTENIFQFLDLVDKYSLIQLKTSVFGYICNNFQILIDCDGFSKVHKSSMEEFVIAVKDKVKSEDLFQVVYKWSENQATIQQAQDPILNINDAIKNKISGILHHIDFGLMDLPFLYTFVAPKWFIFPTREELSAILCDRVHFFEGKVTITNEKGQTLHGNVIQDKSVMRNIDSLKLKMPALNSASCFFWDKKFKRPSTPSPIQKKDNVQFYLYYVYERISISVPYWVCENAYLLAELAPGHSGFDTAKGSKIEIE